MLTQAVPYIQDFEGEALDIESPVPLVPRDVERKPYHTAGEARIVQSARAVASAEAGTVSNFPAHLYPPRDAFVLDLPLNRIPFVLGAGLSVSFALWPRVPQGQVGVVRKLAIVVTAGALANLRFTTRVNGAPVQPFPGAVGAIGTLENPQEILVALAAGDVFDVLCTETGGVGVTVAVRSMGWFYSEERR